MRIRKRWPSLLPPTPPPAPAPSSSSAPPVTVTVTPATAPDLPFTRPVDLQSRSLGVGCGGGGLHTLADLSAVQVSSKQSPPPPRDSPNPSLLQRPDLQLTIVRGTYGWICAGSGRDLKPNCKVDSDCNCFQYIPSPPTHLQNIQVGEAVIDGVGGTEVKHVEIKSLAAANNRINANNPGAGAATSVGISASTSLSHQGGRWCEGERAFPLKKRRGSYERKLLSDDTLMEKEKKMKTKVRTKVPKKWVHEDDDENEEDDEKHEVVEVQKRSAKKRGSTGGLIMEGSRCSRVNGRGWRCYQQTLVGYSLCEHHLGKGRLRSMSSVRNRASTITNRPKKEDETGLLSSSSSSTATDQCLKNSVEDDDADDDDEEEEDQKPLITKKRKKIGIVKARSIRSLLGQTNIAPVVTLRPSSNPIGHI